MFDEIANKIYEEYAKRVLGELLPNQIIAQLSGSGESLINMVLASENQYWKGSDYFINPKGKQFIHFTSFDKTKEIIANNNFRLYDLNFADDPHEILFTLKNIGITTDIDCNKLKSYLFSISFCDYNLSENDEHNMWRLYGADGYGIGLVFSFLNDCENWNSFHLSKMYYNQSNKISDAFTNHKAFFDEVNLVDNYTHAINEYHLLSNLLELFAFHKHSIYGSEKEYRLLYRFDQIAYNFVDIKRVFTINKRKKLSSYIELKLCEFSKENFKMEDPIVLPLIKLDKIILGYRYSQEEKDEIEQTIREMYAWNHDNQSTVVPIIEITSLKENYFNQ
jgi:hypothetical protein